MNPAATAITESASADLVRRFGGIQRLYGPAAAQRIFGAHVAVVGIGGVGSWAAEALARSGVGRITLIDLDHVAESNINRQVHAVDSTLGMAKVAAMRERIHAIHPGCVVEMVDDFVTPENWPAVLPDAPDAVIDACDQMSAKWAMARWALQLRVPFVTVGAAGGKRLAHAVEVADLSDVTHDPLLARLRYRLRRAADASARKPKGRIGLTCVFSREAVARPQDDAACAVAVDASLNCHGYGSLVTVTATFGLCAANTVLERVAASKRI